MNAAAEIQITKEIVKDVICIMTGTVRKEGANDESWKSIGQEIMDKYEMTEKGALMIMRAAMSIVNGEIHPALNN
jgi:hypothetical protein